MALCGRRLVIFICLCLLDLNKIVLNNDTCKLSLPDLRLWVNLGCSLEEKAQVQPISVHIQLSYANPPSGTQTDQLTDVICYQHIVELASATATQKAYNLIEHLAASIHQTIQQYLTQINYKDTHVVVTIHKLSPPIPNVLGGVLFRYSGKTT